MTWDEAAKGVEADYAIIGAGVLGSIIAAHLTRSSHRVVMLARGNRARHLSLNGARLKGLANFVQDVRIVEDPANIKQAGTLILATKAGGTAALLSTLGHVRVGMALSLQNGIQQDEALALTFGRDKTIGALADISGEMLADGSVAFTRNVGLILGELNGEISLRCEALVQQLNDAGINCSSTADIQSLQWSKFTGWAGLVVASLLLRKVTWECLCDREGALLIVRIAKEVAYVASVLGIELTDNSLLPAKTIGNVAGDDAVNLLIARGERFRIDAPDHKMSALQDLEAGRALEVDEIFLAFIRQAMEMGVEVPVLASSYRAIKADVDIPVLLAP